MFMTVKDMVNKRTDNAKSRQQFVHSIHKLALQKELQSKTDAVEEKIRTENRKVIVRSSYFQHKQVNESDQEDKQEKLIVEDDVAIDISENANLGSEYSENSNLNSTTIKRKTSINDIVQIVGASFYLPMCSFLLLSIYNFLEVGDGTLRISRSENFL